MAQRLKTNINDNLGSSLRKTQVLFREKC